MRNAKRFQPGVAMLTAVLAATIVSPAVAPAQTRSLSWTETTRMEVPGTLGTILRLTGAADPVRSSHQLHLQGRSLIQEDDGFAVVMDLDRGRWITVDHAAKSYTTLTFAEMAKLSREARASVATTAASGRAGRSGEAREEREKTMEEVKAELNFRVNSQATGRKQSFGPGITGSQHYVTAEFEATTVPEGVEEPEGGSLVFLAELWQTDDVPSEQALHADWARMVAADARLRSLSEDVAESAESANEALATSLTAWDPQVGAGLARMAEATKELTGTTVRSITTVALVPRGVKLDRDELLAWEPASMGDQLRSGASGAARKAAAGAARGAVRGLTRGMFGRGGGDTPAKTEPAAAAPPAVHPLLRVTTTREGIAYRESSDDVMGALESRIAGYERRTYEDVASEMAK